MNNIFTSVNDPEVARLLMTGGIGVLRTDTLYGLVALAADEAAVERIFTLKGRDADKSPIVLVDSVDRLYDQPDVVTKNYLSTVWPGPVSVIIPSFDAPEWIRRSNDSVAYRLPNRDDLRQLLASVGPLVAPSANRQSETPAMTVQQAVDYFGDNVDFYVDGGPVGDASPSQLIQIDPNSEVTRLR